MIARYPLDPGHSRFTVQTVASGFLSFLGHSPTFVVREFAGVLELEGNPPRGGRLQAIVRADSLVAEGDIRPSDRQDMEGRMRAEVLASAAYPEIRFEADELSIDHVAEEQNRLRIRGRLALHGVTNSEEIDSQLLIYHDGIRLTGEFPLLLSDYGIRPVTALGGSIKLQDRLRVTFDLVAWKEGPQQEGT